ncbi:MAG: hypothetical protein HQL31_01435, partial [Planctomycetes bacterium]|nr:hypothetical protein [Planctomycetota bacterium]
DEDAVFLDSENLSHEGSDDSVFVEDHPKAPPPDKNFRGNIRDKEAPPAPIGIFADDEPDNSASNAKSAFPTPREKPAPATQPEKTTPSSSSGSSRGSGKKEPRISIAPPSRTENHPYQHLPPSFLPSRLSPTQGEDHFNINFRTLIFIAWYHKIIILLVIAIIFCINAYFVFKAPTLYESQVQLLKVEESDGGMMMFQKKQEGISLETAAKIIQTYPILNASIFSARQVYTDFNNGNMDMISNDMIVFLEEIIKTQNTDIFRVDAGTLSGMISTTLFPEQSIFVIHVQGTSPPLLGFMAQMLAKTFIDRDTEIRRIGNQNSMETLEMLLREKDAEIQRLNQDIASFNEDLSSTTSVDNEKSYQSTDMRSLLDQLFRYESRYQDEMIRISKLKSSIGYTKELMSKEMRKTLVGKYETELTQLQSELTQALSRYTENNPKV